MPNRALENLESTPIFAVTYSNWMTEVLLWGSHCLVLPIPSPKTISEPTASHLRWSPQRDAQIDRLLCAAERSREAPSCLRVPWDDAGHQLMDDFVQFCSHHTERESDKLQGASNQQQWSWSDSIIGGDARNKINLVVLK